MAVGTYVARVLADEEAGDYGHPDEACQFPGLPGLKRWQAAVSYGGSG